MLDMDLVEGRPALQVEFRVSLVKDLTEALGIVMNAPWIEGLDQWVYATHAALPDDLRSEMEVVLLLLQKCQGFSLQVCQLSDDHQHKGEKGDDEQVPDLDDLASVHAFLAKHNCEETADRSVHLIQNPAELKTLFISIVTRFWDQFYKGEYQRYLAQMERSVTFHRHQNYGGDFATVFEAVAGRRLPKTKMEFDEMEQVVFVPSGFVGPYVMFTHDPEVMPSKFFVHYNCRPTGAPEREEVPTIGNIFPPLKALADETRLQILSLLDGRELYAQEIVDELDISQSAVSRHLKLMITGGLLKMRKKDSMKYLTINEEALAALAERLTSFKGKRE